MRLELIIGIIILGIIYNAYTGNKYGKYLQYVKRIIKPAFMIITVLGIYKAIKNKDTSTKGNMLISTMKYINILPVSKGKLSEFSPIYDLTTNEQNGREMFQGFKPTKRAVSETKKKYVACQQDWKCSACKEKLMHTFEVDHKIRLENGGTNDVSNLVAMCRECHGQKTAFENM